MALTSRGRVFSALIIAIVVAALVAVGVVAFGSHKTTSASGNNTPGSGPTGTPSPTPPPVCPLTGVRPHGSVPNRPALAVKVENLPAARPQTGLSWADIIYEEPVEAGITRFIVVYQCADASRIEPIRSGRYTDADLLPQFGRPIFAYAGGQAPVVARVALRHLIDVNFMRDPGAYHRDPNRPAPHNLYSSTRELYAAAHTSEGAPHAVFTYSGKVPFAARKVSLVHVPFSSSSDVFWKWFNKKWNRYYGSDPAVLSDGTPISATNVVVQLVKITLTELTDVNGAPSPYAATVGSGDAFIFRNGRVIVGKWVRPSLRDVTKFLDKSGNEIALAPGNTWVELLPNDLKVRFS